MSRRRATSQPPPRRVSAPLSFVGRDRELAELREHLAGAPLVVLYGPIGAGKTSLVEQLAQALEVPTTQVRCFPGERGGSVKSRAERRLRCPPGGLAEALAQESQLLVIDDLHHLAPDEAARVVAALAPAPGALGRVIAIGREALLLPADLDRNELELGGLDDAAADALWQALAAAYGPTGEIGPALMRTRGLPLLLRREFARARFGDDAWNVAALPAPARRALEVLTILRLPVLPAAVAALAPEVDLEVAVEALVARQLIDGDDAGRLRVHDLVQELVMSELALDVRMPLERAAATMMAPGARDDGALAALDVVDRLREAVLHHLAAGQVASAVRLLVERADVLARRGAGGEVETLIAAIGPDAAPELGVMQVELAARAGRVAEAAERLAAGAVGVSPILAAELALASGDVDGAVRRLALIARASADGHKELLPFVARGAALHAEIDLLRGRPGDARLRVEQAMAGPTPPEGRAHLLVALAAIDDHEGHPTAVRAALTRAVGALASSDAGSEELSAIIEARRACGLAREGRLGEARTTLDEALARTRGLDAVPVVEQVNESRAILDMVRGDCEAAVKRLGATVAARRGRGDELGALCAEIALAEVEIRRGDLARAAELATAGKAQATRLGFQALADRAAVVLAAVDLGEMRLERAREALDRLIDSPALTAVAACRAAQLSAEVRAASGQRAGTVDAARGAGSDELQSELERDLAEARVATAAGDIGRALSAARRVAAAAERSGRAADLAEALVIGCRLELAKGDRGGARAQASRAAREAAAAGLIRPRAHALLALASLARDDGDLAAAATYARDAAELAQHAGLPVERLAATAALDAITGGDPYAVGGSGAAAAMSQAAIEAAGRLLTDLGLTAVRPFRVVDAAGSVSEVADADPEVLRLAARTLAVDAVRETIWRKGTELADLRRRSLLKKLLFLFAAAPHRTFSKEEIVQTVWNVAYHPLRHDAALFTNIMRIRRLLGEDGAEIIRVTEDGYRFEPPTDFVFVHPA
jgi:hypothetical protein